MIARKWARRSAGGRGRAPRVERLEERLLLAVTINEFPISTAQSSPAGIVEGPDGRLWFTESVAGKIGVINPQTKAFQEFNTQNGSSTPLGITVGPDGQLWFAEQGSNALGEITTTGTVHEYTIPSPIAFPFGVATGPDGNVWFTETSRNAIDDYNPTTHAFGTEVTAVSNSAEPYGITAGPTGNPNLYFTEQLGNAIGIYNTQTHAKQEIPTPTAGSNPSGIALGPDGNIWFTEGNTNKIGVLNTTTNVITEYTIPTANSVPNAITAGPDGNLWFTEAAGGKVGRITTSGQITEYNLPTANSQPAGIAAGPGGTLWVTEQGANKIAVVNVGVTGLQITGTTPADGSVVSSLPNGQVVVTFSEPIAGLTDGQSPIQNSGTFNPYDVFLLARGPDGAFSAPSGADQGDLPLHANVVYHINGDGTSEFVITPTEPLSSDVYAISLQLSAFTDASGNPLTDGRNGYRTFLLQEPAVNASQSLQVTGVTEFNGYATINNNAVYQPDTIQIHFNKPLYAGAAGNGNVQLIANPGANFTVVPSVAAYSPTTDSIYLTPTAPLNPGTVYAIRVAGQDAGSSFVSDDQGFGATGYPLLHTFYDTFTVLNAPAGAGQSPFTVATDSNQNPRLMPIPSASSEWSVPVGYASVQFSEALDPTSLGRFSTMLIPRSGGLDTNNFDPADVPLNATLAFNPNTDQLIIVPSQPVGNDIYLYSLNNMKATNGDPLLNNAGQPAGISGNAPYYATFGLNAAGSPAAAVVTGRSAASYVALTVPATPAPAVASQKTTATPAAIVARSRPPQPVPTGPRTKRFLASSE
ncbi:MAG: SMP-30/gluconolactonase/LRE family protein [Isosphaeraceae bacterium]|nr:SMP-30/gluconolactonase/LRE family protein [Isosphaeraceae bacterium]